MGQYKVPQNVEAEDHILGTLTFRQFIFAMIGFGWAAICFAAFRKVIPIMLLLGFPPTMLLMLLAFYTKDGQNFEQILIAMVGFFAAPRKRYWVKETDAAETFHVEPTKHLAEVTQRNPQEVMSELEKLSTLIDSRGWNKPPDVATSQLIPAVKHEERIVTPPTPHAPDEPKTDMLDAKSPLAQNLAELLRSAAEDVREEAMSQMTTKQSANRPAQAAQNQPAAGVTPAQTGDILKLATQSDDITVSQVAAQATRMNPPVPLPGPMEAQPSGSQ